MVLTKLFSTCVVQFDRSKEVILSQTIKENMHFGHFIRYILLVLRWIALLLSELS